jgi:aryl-alcohol dehydrogenase-like predicted oxidoreductase
MHLRTFGRTGWQVSDIGYGMWGMGGWSGSDDEESLRSLHRAVELGCNFFDTAWAYGEGRSERLLGQLIHAFPKHRLYVATKIPPKNLKWPSKPDYRIEDTFPPHHIREYVEKSLRNLNLDTIDLIQFHVWNDSWSDDKQWQYAMQDLKREGLVRAIGISVNRWEPENVLQTLQTGLIDAVQVIYNIFDQAPEDSLFPLCQELNVAVIARVPFDEGSLTGTLTTGSTWPKGDWRNTYFVEENLRSSVNRAEAVRALLPRDMTMPEMALRFILSNPVVCTTIPGMRKIKNAEANIQASDKGGLGTELLQQLRQHRWERKPTPWSQ